MKYWPAPRLQVGGLAFLTVASDQSLVLVSYHPRRSPTWHWSVSLVRSGNLGRDAVRMGQWHDYYWLPFGRRLLVSQQDFHRTSALLQAERSEGGSPQHPIRREDSAIRRSVEEALVAAASPLEGEKTNG